MKIDSLNLNLNSSNIKAVEKKAAVKKDFSSLVTIREGNTQGVNLPKNANKDLVQDFAEWYFKEGKSYETTKSYKQAISAYEKSNSVEPDINKAHMIDQVRKKEFDQ